MRFGDGRQRDRWLAAVLLVLAEAQVVAGSEHGWRRVGAVAVTALVTAAVAVRRDHPALVGIGVQALMAGQSSLGLLMTPSGPPVAGIAWFCGLYALAVWTSTAWFVAGAAFFVASDVLLSGGVAHVNSFTAGGVVVMVLVRRIVREREQQLRVAARERDLLAREAVVEERARIAREMHDVIAHHVSMMVLQAGAERRVLAAPGSTTHETLTTIERIGRAALTEMRRLVGMLRSDAADSLTPQPGVSEVPALVEQMRQAGLPVELAVTGEPQQLPEGISLSVYRIVQEGLTNALKHSGGSRTKVKIAYQPDALAVDVQDSGGPPTTSTPAGGHGLVGIRERVALYGGTLDAGPQPAGGFRLSVKLPVS